MKEEILSIFENFVIEHWGRVVLEEAIRTIASDCSEYQANELELPRLLAAVARQQQIETRDLLFALGKFSFPYFAAKMPKHDRSSDHPKKFLMAMHRLLSGGSHRSTFVHFHYVDCGPEELLMIYKTQQSFSSFVEGFIEGAAQSFSHQIDCQPVVVRDGEVSGCRFLLTFKGEL